MSQYDLFRSGKFAHLEHLAWFMCTNNLSNPCKGEEIGSNINLSE